MSQESKPVTVTILDKEYLVACDEHEREQLHTAVRLLNQKMQEVRNSGKVIGTERIAVMAALNMAHELIDYKSRNEDYTSRIGTDIQRLRQKIDQVLNKSPA
jgi:cell division protein ZapA